MADCDTDGDWEEASPVFVDCTCEHAPEEHTWGHCDVEGCPCEGGREGMTAPKSDPIKGPLYVERAESYDDPNGQTAVDYTLRDGDGFPVFFQDPMVLLGLARAYNYHARLVEALRGAICTRPLDSDGRCTGCLGKPCGCAVERELLAELEGGE